LQALLADHGTEVALGTIWRFFPRRGITRKKTAHVTEQDRPDIVKRRKEWFDGELDLDPEQPIFIDKTWASTNMARRYCRSPRGERLRTGVPAYRRTGVPQYRSTARAAYKRYIEATTKFSGQPR